MIDPADKEAFLALTACDDLQTMRITHRVREEIDRARTLRTSSRSATTVAPAAVARLRRRLVEGPTRRSARPLGWGLAVAAIAAVVLGFALGRHPGWTEQTVTDAIQSENVALELDGLGTVGGTRQSPEIRWESGTLRVAVTPNRDVHLSVLTPEATVRVIGTQFAVDRADFATVVTVSHGTVEVTCTGGDPLRVPAPGVRRCLPSDAATLLRRVSALRRSGADADVRLESIDAGLAVASSGSPLEAELLAHRADLLSTTARDGDAMDAASAYLRIGGPRQPEMIELLAGLGARDRGCSAVPVLEQVVAADPQSRWGVPLAACLAESDPRRAREILDRVPDPGEFASEAADLRGRLGRDR